MPTSSYHALISILTLAEQIRPKSVFEIGVGFGKLGFLFREYLDVWSWQEEVFEDPNDFKWSVRIDGAEIDGQYIKDLQRKIYNDIHVGDAREVIDKIPSYDLVVLGDVIEHFDKDEGKSLVEKCYQKANKAVMIITPALYRPQHALYGNEAERHLSLWTPRDFKSYSGAQSAYVRGKLVAVLNKGEKRLRFDNRYAWAGSAYRMLAAVQARRIERRGLDAYRGGLVLSLFHALRESKRLWRRKKKAKASGGGA